MTKTATITAQQKWEYIEVTRKTEGYLTNELNVLGQAGWELVSVMFHKDTKSSLGSSMVWTAFMKRPQVPGAAAAPSSETTTETTTGTTAKPADVEEVSTEPIKSPPSNMPARKEPETDGGDEIFDFKDE